MKTLWPECKEARPAKLLLVHSSLVMALLLVISLEGACENWLGTPVIPGVAVRKLDAFCCWAIASVGMSAVIAFSWPCMYCARRNWAAAKMSAVSCLGAAIVIAAMAPFAFVMMILLEMRM